MIPFFLVLLTNAVLAPPEGDANWSFGIGFSSLIVSSSGDLSDQVLALADIERRLSRRLWLGFGVEGTYYSTQSASEFNGPTTSAQQSGRGGGFLTLRYIINPGGFIEVSPMLWVGGSVGYTHEVDASTPPGQATVVTSEKGLSDDEQATLGVALERELIPRLYLRVALNVAQLEHSHSPSLFAGSTSHNFNDGWSASLIVEPTGSLRFAF
jgi:hypothetical protein